MIMTTKRHIEFTEDGAFAVDVSRSPYILSDAFKKFLSTKVPRRTLPLFSYDDKTSSKFGASRLISFDGHAHLVTRVYSLPLNIRTVVDGQCVVPSWDRNIPTVMNMQWAPGSFERLFVSIQIIPQGDQCSIGDIHLVLLVEDLLYRLPLGNIHADCKLCHGQSFGVYDTIYEAGLVAIQSFSSSEWNADLLSDTDDLNSRQLFRWESRDGNMYQVNVHENKRFCENVSTQLLTNIFLGGAI